MRSRWIWMTVTAAMATCLSSAEQAMAQAEKQLSNSIGMKLVLIPAGTFQMGTRLTPVEVHQRYPGGKGGILHGRVAASSQAHQIVLPRGT